MAELKLQKYDLWASLWNFEAKTEERTFKIDEYLISKQDRESFSDKFWNKFLGLKSEFDDKDVTLLFRLTHLYTTQKNRDYPPYMINISKVFKGEFNFLLADKIIKKLLLGLRLYQSGNVRGRLIAGTLNNDSYGTQHFFDIDQIPITNNDYILNDVSKFEKFFINLGNVEDIMDSIAIDRFGVSYLHNNPLEKLIGLLVCLESLFNKSSSDIKYKISIRASHFIESKPLNIHSKYLLINEAYKLRNDVIHGVKITDQKFEMIEQIIDSLEDIVRKVLLKAIRLRTSSNFDLFSSVEESEIDRVIVNK